MKIYPIVEGHGEVQAAPILLRRLLSESQCHGVGIGRPIRRTQAELNSREGVQAGVKLASLYKDCTAVVILFDGEDSCPKELGEKVRRWAREVANSKPCDVVIAYREYETWFLAAIESLRGRCGICADATAPADPEEKRDAKGALEKFMPATRAYSETSDQPSMSQLFDMRLAYQRNRSFRKLVKSVGDILCQLNQPIPAPWPPSSWL